MTMCNICFKRNDSHYIKFLHANISCLLRKYSTKNIEVYKKCFELLGVPANSTQDDVREAYINLVKKVHPDSGHEESSSEMFTKVDSAFRILQAKYAKERRGLPDEESIAAKDFDIKHTAPQHRQYLSYDGIGYGTPAKRQKQYQQARAAKAQEKVVEYRLDIAKASEHAVIKKGGSYYKNHAIKTKYGFDRVVEDLIQEAMSKGDFDNLSCSGKPLTNVQQQNPYVDFTQHKINKILLDNGFCPEWITLQKDIRNELDSLKTSLTKHRENIGPWPLCTKDAVQWTKILDKHVNDLNGINKKIEKYNFLVPILNKQMILVSLEKISDLIIRNNNLCKPLNALDVESLKKGNSDDLNSKDKDLISLVISFFK